MSSVYYSVPVNAFGKKYNSIINTNFVEPISKPPIRSGAFYRADNGRVNANQLYRFRAVLPHSRQCSDVTKPTGPDGSICQRLRRGKRRGYSDCPGSIGLTSPVKASEETTVYPVPDQPTASGLMWFDHAAWQQRGWWKAINGLLSRRNSHALAWRLFQVVMELELRYLAKLHDLR